MFVTNLPRAAPTTEPQPEPRAATAPNGQPGRTEPSLIQRERIVLRDLAHLVADRAATEPKLDTEFQTGTQAAEAKYDAAYQAVIARFAAEKEALEYECQETRQAITARDETERDAARKELTQARQALLEQSETERQEARSTFQEARWTITALLEGIKSGTEKQVKELEATIAQTATRIQAMRQEARQFLEECKLYHAVAVDNRLDAFRPSKEPRQRLQKCLSTAEATLRQLKSLTTPQYFRGDRILWSCGGLWLVLMILSGLLLRIYGLTGGIYALAGSTVGVAALGGGLAAWLYAQAKRQARTVYQPLSRALAEAEGLLPICLEQGRARWQRRLRQGKRRYNKDILRALEEYRRRRDAIKQRRLEGWQEAAEKYRCLQADRKQRLAQDWAEITEKHRQLGAAIQERYERDAQQVQEQYDRQTVLLGAAQEHGWKVLIHNWHQGLAQAQTVVAEINQESSRLFPSWTDPCWTHWAPAAGIPTAIRFGEWRAGLGQMPNGRPRAARLQTDVLSHFCLPALLPFPDCCSMLLQAHDEGRALAVQTLQAVMFRLLTSIPPGKVRLTILDPVGLGQNFASFMHLADHEKALVTSRIWTEVGHIEQRLADLTGHMENVIQKYLRNQFQTIDEYNLHAGEVAEPYRILVVANFPVNFSSEAARRLVSIIQSGPRCGVYTLLSVDTNQPLPQGFQLEDLKHPGVTLVWQEGRFVWHDPDFEQLPLDLDPPPSPELGNRLLQLVGEQARDANRVEVPFEFVAPPPGQWWTGDSRLGLSVPLGRAGATKRQQLRLGHGTAQHVLLAGKTGSGKSTLLHVLITNLALCYSPEEVELYLVDFKKGVEFKTYATHQLPHARVVAIESEREFGLSVLQRLDAELKHRGDRFREVGAQDLNAYRQAQASTPTPRILLIVDEFQEFFVEDDKIAQEAALLLDRLVRQGRAFGLHVLLGSQTLGGAYTLARSTMDQMAVRIALPCSEADGHIILSDANSAARLLSRPGEAIYNDANGLVEGNNPFQVVWLTENRREQYLQQIQEWARQRSTVPPPEPIVFEGNIPSDLARNHLLHRLLESPYGPARPRELQAWLGEAVAIKDPTAALFRPHSGNHLLIIGQNSEAALGILTAALVSLAAQLPPASAPDQGDGTRFYVLDGSAPDDSHAGFLARLPQWLPHPMHVADWRGLASPIEELAAEVERRQTAHDTDAPFLYLFIHGLQRFRDLRKQEEDFGFARRGEEKPSLAKQFVNILREGPSWGVHTLVWCDSWNNLTRTLERASLREFEMRVLFQMSAADSSNLIDLPLASKLGVHRALYQNEAEGRLEKFRPYGLPSATWLGWVQKQLSQKPARSSASLPL